MATATAPRRDVKEYTFVWEGVDRNNRQVRGEIARRVARRSSRPTCAARASASPRSRSRRSAAASRVGEKDITFFTRQLATMLRAGVPLLQAFEIVARGHSNPRFSRLMMDIKSRIETGSSLSQAFREHPIQFDTLYCNLVSAGETSGMLDAILDRLATYKEKILAIKGKIKSALFYPISVIVVAIVVVWVIMVWVIPAFKQVFTSFGADLPAPTLIVMAMSDFFVTWWWLMVHDRHRRDLRLLRHAATIGGVPLHHRPAGAQDSDHRQDPREGDDRALDAHAVDDVRRRRAAGRVARRRGGRRRQLRSIAAGTKRIQTEVSTGTSLTNAMTNTKLFPSMVLQMTQIGEESGSLDGMLSKIAEFYEREVDDAVAALSSLLEPIIIVFLGVVIGGLVVAMYLPIFKLGSVV